MQNKKNILILYTELAGYTINCLSNFVLKYHGYNVHVVRWPVNKEAPFQFDFRSIQVYDRKEYDDDSLLKLAEELTPQLILTSGWIDKGYVKVCETFQSKIPVVLTLDNHYTGSFKQKILTLLSPVFLKNKFNKVWVPGQKQKEYALRLKFKEKDIYTGFYSANTSLFQEYYKKSIESKQELPRRILYVGRYVEHKGIFEMWNAFIEFVEEKDSEWELWCIGTGDEYDNRIEHPKIKHFGFVQPDDFQDYINQTTVYILPSKFEPWGVSLHEFAAAGFPLLASKKVGASEAFLIDGENGYSFEPSKEEIKDSFIKISELSEIELKNMQKRSIELSLQITPQTWSDTLYTLIND